MFIGPGAVLASRIPPEPSFHDALLRPCALQSENADATAGNEAIPNKKQVVLPRAAPPNSSSFRLHRFTIFTRKNGLSFGPGRRRIATASWPILPPTGSRGPRQGTPFPFGCRLLSESPAALRGTAASSAPYGKDKESRESLPQLH